MKRGLLILILPALCWAQEYEFVQEWDSVQVEVEGYVVPVPWTGGYRESAPDFCDIDADGDLDLFIGHYSGYVDYYQSVGSVSIPDFVLYALNWDSVSCFPNNNRSNPDFWDLDCDGDQDLLIGAGYVRYYCNDGTPTSPDFTAYSDTLFDTAGNYVFGTHVALTDIDSDGDGDLICGEYQGHLQFYRNIGTPYSFAFFLEDDYWLEIDVGTQADPTLSDIDSDGDFDLFIGDRAGKIWYYRNDGTPAQYDFTFVSDNWLGIDVGDYSSPEFTDIDSDGDFDLFIGKDNYTSTMIPGALHFWRNIGTPQVPDFVEETQMYLTLDFGEQVGHKLVDFDFDGDGDLFFYGPYLGCFENVGGPNSPYFLLQSWNLGGTYYGNSTFDLGDLDNDGDLDMILEHNGYDFRFYNNIGNPNHPVFEFYENYSIYAWYAHHPSLGDLDADGDLDGLISLYYLGGDYELWHYDNVGTPERYIFHVVSENFQGLSGNDLMDPSLVDFDGDGDLDLMLFNKYLYTIWYYENIGSPSYPNMVLVSSNLLGTEGSWAWRPEFYDLDADGDLDVTVATYDGGIKFFRNVTGENRISYLNKSFNINSSNTTLTLSPNPANPVTWISFTLPAPQEAKLAVYNILGAKVVTLASGLQMPGTHNYIWNASQYSSGVYIIRLETPQHTSSQRVMVVK